MVVAGTTGFIRRAGRVVGRGGDGGGVGGVMVVRGGIAGWVGMTGRTTIGLTGGLDENVAEHLRDSVN